MASLKYYSLPNAIHEIQNEMNRLFEQTGELASDDSQVVLGQWIPAVDIEDKENCLLFRLDVPGVKPEEIEVSIDNGKLVVKGQKEGDKVEERKNYFRSERYCGSFYRCFSLPENVDTDKITAKDKHGVLEICLPKTAKKSKHTIQIECQD